MIRWQRRRAAARRAKTFGGGPVFEAHVVRGSDVPVLILEAEFGDPHALDILGLIWQFGRRTEPKVPLCGLCSRELPKVELIAGYVFLVPLAVAAEGITITLCATCAAKDDTAICAQVGRDLGLDYRFVNAANLHRDGGRA